MQHISDETEMPSGVFHGHGIGLNLGRAAMERFAIKCQTECVEPTPACRDRCAFTAAQTWAAGLVALLWIFCPIGSAQKVPPTFRVDPFIPAIEKMKHAVASLDCLAVSGAESKILERMGTAFFISDKGDFLTAAHVILNVQKSQRPCPIFAIIIPVENWQPDVREELLGRWPFSVSNCRIDTDLDLAACSTTEDLSIARSGLYFKIAPVKLKSRIPPDGTQVSFTGFPLNFRDPMTIRASVAAHRTLWRGDMSIGDLVLDRAAWPGSSGSPVYLPDGSVIAVMIATGKDEGSEVAVARSALLISDKLLKRPKK
jgi:hypothetical protein